MSSERLEQSLAVRDYEAVVEQSNASFEALKLAEIALEEILRYPRGGLVDMLELRKSIARKAGMEDPQEVGGCFPEIEDSLIDAKDAVTNFALREQSISEDATSTKDQIKSGAIRIHGGEF